MSSQLLDLENPVAAVRAALPAVRRIAACAEFVGSNYEAYR